MIYNDPALFAREAKKVTITLTGAEYMSWNPNYVYVVIEGVKYGSAASLEVKAGTIIDCVANGSEERYSTVRRNGASQKLEEGNDGAWHYYYTVWKDATFVISSEGFPGGNTAVIDITEIPSASPAGDVTNVVTTQNNSHSGRGDVNNK